ncbi:MAG: hypothetical protein K2F60_00140 [Oscillospiraceae bacterium]|nr:hypothetical protein [Oscillospiraceae bacterium]
MIRVKRFISVLMAAMMIGTFGMSVSANELNSAVDDEIILHQEYAESAYSTLAISSKKATCTSYIKGKSGVTKIYVTQILQKKISSNSWTDHAIWYRTEYSSSLTFTNTSGTLASGTYRVKSIVDVYKGTSCETITTYSPEVSC